MNLSKEQMIGITYLIGLAIVLFLVWKVYNFMFGQDEDEKAIEEGLKDIENKKLKGNMFEQQWYNNLVKTYGLDKVKSAQNKNAVPYAISKAKLLADNLDEFYVTDNQANIIIGVFNGAPSQLSIFWLGHWYKKETGVDLLADLEEGLDDNELAKVLTAINKKPLM